MALVPQARTEFEAESDMRLIARMIEDSTVDIDTLEYAATNAYYDWFCDDDNRTNAHEVPTGWIGGQVRNAMPGVLDFHLRALFGDFQATTLVGRLFYPDTESSASRQHYIDTGRYMPLTEQEIPLAR